MISGVGNKARSGWRRECQDVDTAEIRALTRQAIHDLLTRREIETAHPSRRQTIRWPFPGTVELWIPEPRGGERYALATAVNLSREGIGVKFDEDLPPGMCLQVAIHEPEVSFHGRTVVRHSTPGEDGGFVLGLQFVFEAA